MQDFFEVYADRIDRRGEDECWPWTGSTTSAGYGNLRRDQENEYAHRAAYEAEHGEGSAEGLIVRHSCDNPPCCNPRHLIGGTYTDNVRDMIERGRGRWLHGDESPRAKLSSDLVLEMRAMAASGVSIADIARRHPHLGYMTVNAAVRGVTWRRLPGAVPGRTKSKAGESNAA